MTHCSQLSPCSLENILLCSPRAGAEGLQDLPKPQWVWMALSSWHTGDRGAVGTTTADGSHCHFLNPPAASLRSSVCSRQETGKHHQQPSERFGDTHLSEQSLFCPEQREAQSSSDRAALPSRAGSGEAAPAAPGNSHAGEQRESHPHLILARSSESRKAFAPLVHPDQSSHRCFAGGRTQKQEPPPPPSARARSSSPSRA